MRSAEGAGPYDNQSAFILRIELFLESFLHVYPGLESNITGKKLECAQTRMVGHHIYKSVLIISLDNLP